jgi:hypothetical protein
MWMKCAKVRAVFIAKETTDMPRKWETFTFRSKPVSSKVMRVSLNPRGTFSLNHATFEAMGHPEAVELLFDRESKVVGFKPVGLDVRHAYQVRTQKNSKSYLVGAQAFCKYYEIEPPQTMAFEPELADGILEVDLKKSIEIAPRKPSRRGNGEQQPKLAMA